MSLICFFLSFYYLLHLAEGYYLIELSNNGPVVVGSTILFKAELTIGEKLLPNSQYIYYWEDDALPPHSGKVTNHTLSFWNASYEKPGPYEVEVTVYLSTFLGEIPITSSRQKFDITMFLNGNLELIENNRTIPKPYVPSGSPINHTVSLKQADADYLKNNASSVLSYWFMDCVYQGVVDGMTFPHQYKSQSVAEDSYIETFVIASHEVPTPAPTTPTTTTTISTTPITTTVSTTPTSTTISTTPAGTNTLSTTTAVSSSSVPTTTVSAPSLVVNTTKATPSAAHNDTNISSTTAKSHISSSAHPIQITGDQNSNSAPITDTFFNFTLVRGKNYSHSEDFPFVCRNSSSIVPYNGMNTYGYFSRKLKIRDPIKKVSINGTNWLKQGDMLNLGVSCDGSGPYTECVNMYIGEYNVTGNETCNQERVLIDCQFTIYHYLKSVEVYTLVIIISNEVSRNITPVAVNIYEVTKHPQLSVIIVPVTCSAIAVIIIVFGIAYYLQSRSRYTIEVADFDFSQSTDMEYKTFQERLRDAMSNAINRTQDYVEEGNVWSPSRKYGSMQ